MVDRGRRGPRRRAAARTYRQRIADYSSWHTLDLFYERTEIKRVIEHFPLKHRAGVHRDVKRARRKDHLRAVAKLTSVADGKRRFVDDPPLIVHLDATDHDLDEAEGLIESYRPSLPDERRSLFDRYRLVDVSRKVVGVGSVGTRCWIALMAGPDDPDADFVVLQAKEAQASVLEPYAGESAQGHHGKRVVVGQRRIQAASDIFLGWAEGPRTGRNYYIRQLWDYKGQGDPMTMSRTNLVHYGELCAWILARSHARTGDAIAISAYLGEIHDLRPRHRRLCGPLCRAPTRPTTRHSSRRSRPDGSRRRAEGRRRRKLATCRVRSPAGRPARCGCRRDR